MEEETAESAVVDGWTIPDPLLRSALEFAVGIAAAGAKLRPPLPYPDALRPFLRLHRVPPSAFARVRRAIEDDPAFLARLGEVASAELVDELGLHWLRREPGWRAAIDGLLDTANGSDQDRSVVAREQRRRQAAEESAAKARGMSAAAQLQLAHERSAREQDRLERQGLVDELRLARARSGELEGLVASLREQLASAQAAAAAAEASRAEASAHAEAAEAARDAVLAARVEVLAGPVAPFDVGELRRAHEHAVRAMHESERAMRDLGRLVSEVRSAPPSPTGSPSAERLRRSRRERPRRSPLPIPGGLYGDSTAVAEHLLRVPGVLVLVDGYNVAKLGWPALELPEQRELCVAAAENVARRWGTAITVVFDGADVVGTSGARRLVRVVFSPAGVTADDVLRAEVTSADHAQPLVVVSNDQAVVSDVRADGANTLSSDQFLAVARR